MPDLMSYMSSMVINVILGETRMNLSVDEGRGLGWQLRRFKTSCWWKLNKSYRELLFKQNRTLLNAKIGSKVKYLDDMSEILMERL